MKDKSSKGISRYKEGDEFKATVVVYNVEDYGDDDYWYVLKIKEFDSFLDESYQAEDIARAFDPEYKKQKLLEQKKQIEDQLKELEELN